MKTYSSRTVNRGKTIILESISEAIEIGRKYIAEAICENEALPPSFLFDVNEIGRDKEKEIRKTTAKAFSIELNKRFERFEMCVNLISAGNPALNEALMETAESLVDLVRDIEPKLRGSYAGFVRGEEGIAVSADLVAAGDEQPFFRHQRSQEGDASSGRSESYRIILSTDTSWFGSPEDNAVVVAALILCLQQFGPVELWIQQGWLGENGGDGVTLTKLDYSSSFEPAQIAFWCGDDLKDTSFSFEINMALGRRSGGTAKYAEIPADLFLRGDWMKFYGIDKDFIKLLHTEKMDVMARWVAETAMQILSSDPCHGGVDENPGPGANRLA
jgi:hypothetical protein